MWRPAAAISGADPEAPRRPHVEIVGVWDLPIASEAPVGSRVHGRDLGTVIGQHAGVRARSWRGAARRLRQAVKPVAYCAILRIVQAMESGLRTEKKWATRRRLSTAAQELVLERGLDGVTVEEIAAAAGVSQRTFFNYFSGKDEALVGADPSALQSLADELLDRPASEGPTDALRAVILDDDVDGMLRRWELRNQLVRRYPALLPRHLTAMVQVEEALAAALAERLGVDPNIDPAPRALVAAALAVSRAVLVWWWEQSDRTTPLAHVFNDTFARVIASPSEVS